ncbi:hypothetical protein [Hymenobacter rubidus]|uniref:hypothetical protein n=1 Tax=Hymenobacter rubidus TaxID=1441626 RepID=UPI00191F9797|nr:hypothetical protein [Hymenobacter rubidus]
MRKRIKRKLAHPPVDQEWTRIRNRLTQAVATSNPTQAIELLDLCRADAELKQWRPYLSMGRLCLERPAGYARCYSFDFPCLYFFQGDYTVADAGNYKKWPFPTAEAAVYFARQHLFTVPLSPEFQVLLEQEATVASFRMEWSNGTAFVELRSAAGPSWISLSGVTACEATNFNIIAEHGYAILSLEYDNESMRLYLKNGDHIRVTATALAIQPA